MKECRHVRVVFKPVLLFNKDGSIAPSPSQCMDCGEKWPKKEKVMTEGNVNGNDRLVAQLDYRKPDEHEAACMAHVGEAIKEAAARMGKHGKPSAETTLAIRKLQEARMWFNASVIANGMTVGVTDEKA